MIKEEEEVENSHTHTHAAKRVGKRQRMRGGRRDAPRTRPVIIRAILSTLSPMYSLLSCLILIFYSIQSPVQEAELNWPLQTNTDENEILLYVDVALLYLCLLVAAAVAVVISRIDFLLLLGSSRCCRCCWCECAHELEFLYI
jgi:hypothetical protein